MTRGRLPQRAGLPGLNGGGAAAAVPSHAWWAKDGQKPTFTLSVCGLQWRWWGNAVVLNRLKPGVAVCHFSNPAMYFCRFSEARLLNIMWLLTSVSLFFFYIVTCGRYLPYCIYFIFISELINTYPRDAKAMKKIPPFRSYNKFQSSRKSGVYSN